MFETIGHHTIKDEGSSESIEKSGPFLSRRSFLGDGYYFWDDHIELAHWWGKVHYNKNYAICEGNIKANKDDFFDLLGSRQDQKYFSSLIEKLDKKNWAIGLVIEFLKDLNKNPAYAGIFPYKVIRAVDIDTKKLFKQKEFLFVNDKRGKTILSPQIIICLLEISDIYLSGFKIVYRKSTVNKF